MNWDMIIYYAKRAKEFEQVYQKPERQSDIIKLARILEKEFSGRDVLEIACGTGYWSQRIASTARLVFALDINRNTIEIAKSKHYHKSNVYFFVANMHHLPVMKGKANAVFAGLTWSHIPLQRIDEFLYKINSTINQSGKVIFLDNTYVEGESESIFSKDELGNTYQKRTLLDGTEHVVIKNFPNEEFIHSKLKNHVRNITLSYLKYYWILKYEL
jgi:ubiquinone/menaquinone biosynthesis C-methylase UbiE